ncbi:MAG: M24 family metallopeptidase, partial [Planctomycetota bacterium]|nr:M24 family metallopeptidase [Planctomycetota bacterium]
SFKVIAAAGKNGAVIHYGTPDPERVIRAGELVLLDTGAYYAEGYATDLTRTFLAGSRAEATAEQRRYFTLVLKAAVAGMSARLPVGARGDQLDAITRAPLWAAGLDFNHGTGHGVGINVHESPPRVSPNGAVKLEEGHVFSIEPGVYLPDFGGVRIENLVTLAAALDAPGFLDVVPLTTSRLDERLFDQALLTEAERAWLARYAAAREV